MILILYSTYSQIQSQAPWRSLYGRGTKTKTCLRYLNFIRDLFEFIGIFGFTMLVTFRKYWIKAALVGQLGNMAKDSIALYFQPNRNMAKLEFEI